MREIALCRLPQLKRVGEALGVPTAAAAEEVRQMSEAKLAEDEREPRNVQVVLEDSSSSSGLTLQDERGVFLIIPPEERLLPVEDLDREEPQRDSGTRGWNTRS